MKRVLSFLLWASGFSVTSGYFPYANLLLSPDANVDVRINGSSNDAEEEGPEGVYLGPGNVRLDSSDLEITQDFEPLSSGTQVIGLRFTGLPMPQGAIIQSATISFRAIKADSPNSNSGATNLTIHAQSADNAPAFAASQYNISNRPRSTAAVPWIPAAWTTGVDYPTPDLSSLVQEVVQRPGWTSGNSMVFIITGTGSRSTYSYDGSVGVSGSGVYAPRLQIQYFVPQASLYLPLVSR